MYNKPLGIMAYIFGDVRMRGARSSRSKAGGLKRKTKRDKKRKERKKRKDRNKITLITGGRRRTQSSALGIKLSKSGRVLGVRLQVIV